MRHSLIKLCFLCGLYLFVTALFPHNAGCTGFERRDVTFQSQGQNCAAWYYVPQGFKTGEKHPAIVMAPGWSSVKEMYLDKFANNFAEAGFVVLVFDYRYFGASEGEPRGQIFYFEQQQDYRNAITWLSLQNEVDPKRIGIWGTSYSGGHVLHLGAFDKRVKTVVAQVPVINNWEAHYRNMTPEVLDRRAAWYARNRADEYTKGVVNYFPVVAPEGQNSTMPQKGAYDWFTQNAKLYAPNWRNQVTIESLEINKEFAPATNIQLISPTPLLMIIASDDIVCRTELQIQAFNRAGEPKKLVITEGGHFNAYQGSAFDEAVSAAVEWFKQYLKP